MPSGLLLPLFPLEVVLFPGAVLPLHIFEERYKLMIGEAIESQSEFGVVLRKENAVLNVGCTASVEQVTRRYPDGRMDIRTVGQRRFEILFLDEEKPYLRAGVHYFDDDPATEAPAEAAGRLASLFERVENLMPAAQEPPAASALLSFRLAASLPLDLDFKQRLVASRSEAERVAWLTEYLDKVAPRLELARRVERRARGNGKGRG